VFVHYTRSALFVCAAGLIASACGPGVVVTTASSTELRAALYASSEELSVTPIADRSRLYDAMGAVASDEALRAERDAPVIFPMAVDQQIRAAPFNPALDLLKPAANAPDVQVIDGQEKWSDEQEPGLLGASERDLAVLVSRSLLLQWNVTGPVTVVRSSGFPYAAAFVDGQLRLNPAVLYLAVAHAAPSESSSAAPAAPVREGPVAASSEESDPGASGPPAAMPVSGTQAPSALEAAASVTAPAPSSLPVTPIETAAGLVAAGLLGSWVLGRRR
jgi:hypothetical protein